MRIAVFAATFSCWAGNVLAEGWLCVPDYTTGFAFSQGRWRANIFDVENKTLLIRRPIDGDRLESAYQWIVTEVGNPGLEVYCDDDVTDYGTLVCENLWEFRFSTGTLRYLLSSTFGYWNRDLEDDGGDTPFMEIGRCSPI